VMQWSFVRSGDMLDGSAKTLANSSSKADMRSVVWHTFRLGLAGPATPCQRT
jgi:hypothetical protein